MGLLSWTPIPYRTSLSKFLLHLIRHLHQPQFLTLFLIRRLHLFVIRLLRRFPMRLFPLLLSPIQFLSMILVILQILSPIPQIIQSIVRQSPPPRSPSPLFRAILIPRPPPVHLLMRPCMMRTFFARCLKRPESSMKRKRKEEGKNERKEKRKRREEERGRNQKSRRGVKEDGHANRNAERNATGQGKRKRKRNPRIASHPGP